MKIISIVNIREKIKDIHPRTRKTQLNALLGLIIKGGGILISLLLVPLTIDYLSVDTYGTWLTISSIVTMLSLLDIGIGNGLRNKVSESIANNDLPLSRGYISTAYAVFSGMQLAFTALFLLFLRFIPWQSLLNTSIDNKQLQTIILFTFIGIAIKLVLDILSYVLFAIQKSSVPSLINLVTNILILLSIYFLNYYYKGDLILLAVVSSICPIIVLAISSVILYQNKLRAYRPSSKLINLNYAGSLLTLGYKFFIIQIAVIILFYTDNLIITQLFGPKEVTTYNVVFRYFNSINILFTIAIGPYWSAFSEAATKKDTLWVRQTYRYLQRLWLGLVVIVVIMILLANPVYSIWVGDRVTVPFSLNICMGIFIIISCWNNITVSIANGLSKIHLQLYYAIFAAIINVPLSILFGKGLNMGSSGVILATSVSLLIGSVFGALQAEKLISGEANGVWNK